MPVSNIAYHYHDDSNNNDDIDAMILSMRPIIYTYIANSSMDQQYTNNASISCRYVYMYILNGLRRNPNSSIINLYIYYYIIYKSTQLLIIIVITRYIYILGICISACVDIMFKHSRHIVIDGRGCCYCCCWCQHTPVNSHHNAHYHIRV